MLIIHGVTRSRASRVIWLCHELDLPFRQIPVIQAYRLPHATAPGAPLNTRSPEFLALSPAGAIPVIDDDGLILSESLAATLHLARRHGGPIGPRDAAEDAHMMQWSFYGATSVEPDALTIMMLQRAGADEGDAALVDDAARRLARPLGVIEAHLARRGHLVGDRFTVADLNMAEMLRYAAGYTALMRDHPRIAEWLAACQARPAFVRMWQERSAEPA